MRKKATRYNCPILNLSLSQKPSIQSIARLFSLKNPAIPAGNLASTYHRHLKSSSLQMSVPDNETKAGIFPGVVIIVDSGK